MVGRVVLAAGVGEREGEAGRAVVVVAWRRGRGRGAGEYNVGYTRDGGTSPQTVLPWRRGTAIAVVLPE